MPKIQSIVIDYTITTILLVALFFGFQFAFNNDCNMTINRCDENGVIDFQKIQSKISKQ